MKAAHWMPKSADEGFARPGPRVNKIGKSISAPDGTRAVSRKRAYANISDTTQETNSNTYARQDSQRSARCRTAAHLHNQNRRTAMTFEDSKREEFLSEYPELKPFLTANQKMAHPAPLYKQLDSLYGKISDEAYAHALRRLLKMSTFGVSKDYRLKMLGRIKREDLMTNSELEKLATLPDLVTIYRGATYAEETPGLSWTLKKNIASNEFYEGKLFEAKVSKDAIIAYIADQDEEEILTDVERFNVIEEDINFNLSPERQVENELRRISRSTELI